MLTDKEVKALQAGDRDYKKFDTGGLFVLVTTKGTKSWRFRYTYGGKEKLMTLGQYPAVSLKDARLARDKAKAKIAEGKDPILAAKRQKLVGDGPELVTFKQFALAWCENEATTWKPVHAKDVRTSLERDIFPHIGDFPIEEIDRVMIAKVLEKVEKRGAVETAHRLRTRCESTFKYAAAKGAPVDPAVCDVRKGMTKAKVSSKWPALVDLKEIRALIRDVDATGAQPVTRLASRFLALVAQRPGMVRHMQWSHVTGVDWTDPDQPSPDALWCVPSEQMKLEFALRGDEDFNHYVPLSAAAVEVLRAVRPLTNRGELVFPSSWSKANPLSENTLTYLYARLGYKGRHVSHGWRSSFSTVMNERIERQAKGKDRNNLDRLIIDMMLAHRPDGMSSEEFVYNRNIYMDRRRELFEEWSDLVLTNALPMTDLIEGPRRRPYR